MRDLDELFTALASSRFRSRFHLAPGDAAYLAEKGLPVVMDHARDLIDRRLAPAHPAKDGRQTPWKGHPVFVAQHATACCCRGCLEKWHGIAKGNALTDDERSHVLAAIERWLRRESADHRLVR